MEVMATVFEMISESLMTMLLLRLADGWITLKLIQSNKDTRIYMPLTSFVVAVHIMLGAITYIDQDADHKYHDFQGW